MIRLENFGPSDDGQVQDNFAVAFNEPGFVTVTVDEGGVVQAMVYRGLDTSEHNDPIGAYDNTLGAENNTDWESP